MGLIRARFLMRHNGERSYPRSSNRNRGIPMLEVAFRTPADSDTSCTCTGQFHRPRGHCAGDE